MREYLEKDHTSHRLRGDIFTFAQRLPDTSPKYTYSLDWESVAAIHIASFGDWWEGLPQETRKNVRRSRKRGVDVKVKALDDELIRGIMEVNNDAPFRQGIPNVHYGKSLEQVRKDQASFLDRSDFICAYVSDELVGFVKLVYSENTASILQILAKPSHQDKRVANALLAKAVEVCQAKGIAYLVYGLFNYGNKRNSPLREFKVRNGFSETLVPRYYVPLTTWGRVCLKLKLHRGIVGILPHRMIRLWVEKTRAKMVFLRFPDKPARSSIAEQSNRNRQTECSNPSAGSSS